MGISYLFRLNHLLYMIDGHAIDLNAHSWFHTLLALFRELSTYMKDEDKQVWNGKIKAINQLISQSNKNSMRTGTNEISSNLYSELHSFELFLRDILDKSGLQMKLQEDPTKALQ